MTKAPSYLHWDERTLTSEELSSPEKSDLIENLYNEGFVFTRKGKGVMQQTRSIRIDLSKFELSSENRRILKKMEGISLSQDSLPLTNYDWSLGKLAKDFYDAKFGPGTFSAQKAKELLSDGSKSNFNALLSYSVSETAEKPAQKIGYGICYIGGKIAHYSYPFYDLAVAPKDMGLGMMTMMLRHFKESGLRYAYLGSLQRPTDTYKLQFKGIEWFDGDAKEWTSDLDTAKKILS